MAVAAYTESHTMNIHAGFASRLAQSRPGLSPATEVFGTLPSYRRCVPLASSAASKEHCQRPHGIGPVPPAFACWICCKSVEVYVFVAELQSTRHPIRIITYGRGEMVEAIGRATILFLVAILDFHLETSKINGSPRALRLREQVYSGMPP